MSIEIKAIIFTRSFRRNHGIRMLWFKRVGKNEVWEGQPKWKPSAEPNAVMGL